MAWLSDFSCGVHFFGDSKFRCLLLFDGIEPACPVFFIIISVLGRMVAREAIRPNCLGTTHHLQTHYFHTLSAHMVYVK